MNIEFYNNSSPVNKIGKSLSPTVTLSGELREECDLINPSILLNSNDVPAGNYAHIPAFGRYYFVNKITSVRKGLWRVDMHVDVLQTYASQIKANSPVLERSEYLYNLYLPDNMLPTTQDSFTVTYEFGDEFDEEYTTMSLTDSERI